MDYVYFIDSIDIYLFIYLFLYILFIFMNFMYFTWFILFISFILFIILILLISFIYFVYFIDFYSLYLFYWINCSIGIHQNEIAHNRIVCSEWQVHVSFPGSWTFWPHSAAAGESIQALAGWMQESHHLCSTQGQLSWVHAKKPRGAAASCS